MVNKQIRIVSSQLHEMKIASIFPKISIENNIDVDLCDKLFALTATTAKKQYKCKREFREEFDKFMKSMKLNFKYYGVVEFHNAQGNNDKLHMHAIVQGSDILKLGNLKNQAKNKFKLHYTDINNELSAEKYINYMLKQARYTEGILPESDKPGQEYLFSSDSE